MSVFVIYHHVPDPKVAGELIRKGRMVVDTRTFNKPNQTDAYPMKSQESMLANIEGKPCITILDATAFYYHRRVHPSTKWALTVTTAHGQYTFNCLIMGYKNSNAIVDVRRARQGPGHGVLAAPGQKHLNGAIEIFHRL
ncbi:hypothetical protein GGR54DRAFT_634985 [Hypoxylon sp. NC1633]|nr:hypothetical protein GGR54DRAFT_634985 [Hypoxylon sp. NC1633]